MNVGDLIKKLARLPENTTVIISDQTGNIMCSASSVSLCTNAIVDLDGSIVEEPGVIIHGVACPGLRGKDFIN